MRKIIPPNPAATATAPASRAEAINAWQLACRARRAAYVAWQCAPVGEFVDALRAYEAACAAEHAAEYAMQLAAAYAWSK